MHYSFFPSLLGRSEQISFLLSLYLFNLRGEPSSLPCVDCNSFDTLPFCFLYVCIFYAIPPLSALKSDSLLGKEMTDL